MKKRWYKTWWGILGIGVSFPLWIPILLEAYLTHLIFKFFKKNISIRSLFIVYSILGFFGLLTLINNPPDQNKSKITETKEGIIEASNNIKQTEIDLTSTPNPTEQIQITKLPTNRPIATKAPEKKAVQTPEQVFEGICMKYGGTNNCIYDKNATGAWSVTQLIQPKEDFMLFSTSKQISRDFIFAVYATKLPIAHASITITMNGKYYRAGLGADVADTQPESTWTSKDVGPTIFYDFLISSTNGSAGDGLNSTYIETNLD